MGRVENSARVLISDKAIRGVSAHEGWHVFTQVFLTEDERNGLYNETRKRLNLLDANDDKIEEVKL